MIGVKYSLYVVLMVALTGLLILFSERSLLLFLDTASFLFLLGAFLIYTFTAVGISSTGSYFGMVFRKEKSWVTQEASNYFRNMVVFFSACGVVGFLAGLIMMLANMRDTAEIGPKLAVALIIPFYAMMVILLIPVPFQIILKQKK
ncbi:MAG: MotA/TolQ/ExbB proton channel family protein [Spirochaetaceae bacterium]|jgi:hypothetical protein|nr:MotA/TolQ/ExbB proton channel family protein [Spirochaetaceae bacterium]